MLIAFIPSLFPSAMAPRNVWHASCYQISRMELFIPVCDTKVGYVWSAFVLRWFIVRGAATDMRFACVRPAKGTNQSFVLLRCSASARSAGKNTHSRHEASRRGGISVSIAAQRSAMKTKISVRTLRVAGSW